MKIDKAWLTDNKIFFEIGAALIFGIASIIFGVASYRVSQNQLTISEIPFRPHLFVNEFYIIDDVSGKAYETKLTINNAGAPLTNPVISERTFYVVNREDISYWVPVFGYYFSQYYKGIPTGEISSMRWENNNNNFSTLYKEFLRESFKKSHGFVEISRVTVVRVDYTTQSGNSGTEFFIGERKADNEWIEDVFEAHDKSILLEIVGLTADVVMDTVNNLKNTNPILVRN